MLIIFLPFSVPENRNTENGAADDQGETTPEEARWTERRAGF